MSMHLAEIGRRVAPGAHAALVIDGAGYHVAGRLAVPRNITLVRLPPYAPELNPIENVWEYLRGNKLAITVFESYDDIVDKSCAAWRFFADEPRTRRLNHIQNLGDGHSLRPLVLHAGRRNSRRTVGCVRQRPLEPTNHAKLQRAAGFAGCAG
jgi:transposase